MKKQTAASHILSALLGLAFMTQTVLMTGCSGDQPYDMDLRSYVRVGNYTGIPYPEIEVKVASGEIEEEIQETLEKYSVKTEKKDGVIENGDYANIQYDVEIGGDRLNGSATQYYTIHVGKEKVLEDIDKALVGKKAGEKFQVKTRFPDDFELSANAAGKDALFTITVKKIFAVEMPVLTDEFVSENLGYASIPKYRAALYETLRDEKRRDAIYQAGEGIWNKVLENSEVLKYPKKEVEEKQSSMLESFRILCEKYGTTFEEALDSILKTDEKSFTANIRLNAENAVKEEMILYYIARENNLEMTQEEQRAYLERVLEANGISAREFKSKYSTSIEEYAEESGIMDSLLREKVFGFLVEKGVPQEAKRKNKEKSK